MDLGSPPARETGFHPAAGVRITVDDVLDIADAANQFAPVLPPVSVAGLTRTGGARQAVGLYGTGLTQIMALPLQSRDAGYLARQLRTSGGQDNHGLLLLRVGPLGVGLTFSHHPFDFAWLVTGTVTDDTLVQAARDLDAGTRYRG